MDAEYGKNKLHGCKRLFVDMDGTLAEFKETDTLEILYEKGYFRNLAPLKPVTDAVNELAGAGSVEVFILSACLSDSPYALEEKNGWLDEHTPRIDRAHRLFPPCGIPKVQWLQERGFTIDKTDFLLDDYSLNLHEWERYGTGIKLLNGINHTKGTWQGAMSSLGSIRDALKAPAGRLAMQGSDIQPKFEIKRPSGKQAHIADKSRAEEAMKKRSIELE